MELKKLIIVGAGGHAREMAWLAELTRKYTLLGFLDDAVSQGANVGSYEILGSLDTAVRFKDAEFLVAIGTPRVRERVAQKLQKIGIERFATLIHPSIQLSPSVSIGPGSMVCEGVTLSVDTIIGAHVIINSNSSVAHDCRIDDFCTLAPHVALSGNVTLERAVEVGTGAVIRQGLLLEQGSMLGMGGVLTKNIPSKNIYVGNPAKFFKEFKD